MSTEVKKVKATPITKKSLKKKTINLSWKKFTELLSTNGYASTKVYSIDSKVKFCEVKTPNVQRIFFVCIPAKYCLKTPKLSSIPIVDIEECSEPSTATKNYLMDIRGIYLQCDVISVSDAFVTVYREDGTFENFNISQSSDDDGENNEDETLEVDERETKTKIESIEKDVQNIVGLKEYSDDVNDCKKDTITKEVSHKVNEIFINSSTKDNIDDQTVLDFEDDDGKPVEEVTKKLTKEDDDEKSEDVIVDEEEENNADDIDEDVTIIYYLADLNIFFKNISAFEDVVLDAYDNIEENERENRLMRITNIGEKLKNLSTKIDEEVAKYDKTYADLQANLKGLHKALNKLKDVKVPKDAAERNAASKEKIDKTIEATKKMIYDLNTDMIKNKDIHTSFLRSCDLTLDDLLED